MTWPSIFISWISTLSDAGLRAEMSRSGVVPLLLIVMNPPPLLAVAGVARVQGVAISSDPSL
jgi:hypothetical protein